jgi:transcriptional regulator with XRE-family HTH domain
MSYYDKVRFGQRIKYYRNRIGLTLDDVSTRSGLSKRTLINLEGGNSIPKLESIHILSLVLKVDLFNVYQKYLYNGSSTFHDLSRKSYSTVGTNRNWMLRDMIDIYFDDLITDDAHVNSLIINEIKREEVFLDVHYLYSIHEDKKNLNTKETVIASFKSIGYDYLKSKHTDYISFRMGFLTGDMLRYQKELTAAVELYDRISLDLESATLSKDVYNELKMILLVNQAIVHHRCANYEMILEYCDEGLKLCNKLNDQKFRYVFLMRKCIACFRLNDSSTERLAKELVLYLNSLGNNELFKMCIGSIKKLYSDLFMCLKEDSFIRDIMKSYIDL